jgi:hypothetical protein
MKAIIVNYYYYTSIQIFIFLLILSLFQTYIFYYIYIYILMLLFFFCKKIGSRRNDENLEAKILNFTLLNFYFVMCL